MDLPPALPPDADALPETPAVKQPAAKKAPVKRKFTKSLSVKGKAKAIARKSQHKRKPPKR
jgi:hypothetical protein